MRIHRPTAARSAFAAATAAAVCLSMAACSTADSDQTTAQSAAASEAPQSTSSATQSGDSAIYDAAQSAGARMAAIALAKTVREDLTNASDDEIMAQLKGACDEFRGDLASEPNGQEALVKFIGGRQADQDEAGLKLYFLAIAATAQCPDLQETLDQVTSAADTDAQ